LTTHNTCYPSSSPPFYPEDKGSRFLRNICTFLWGLHGVTFQKTVNVIYFCPEYRDRTFLRNIGTFLPDHIVLHFRKQCIFYSSAMKMETVCSSETSIYIRQLKTLILVFKPEDGGDRFI
jgi:hypothetical protein